MLKRFAATAALVAVSVAGSSVRADDATDASEVEHSAYLHLADLAQLQILGTDESSFWIGVHCIEVDDSLRAHFELPEGVGLLLSQIVPDSPAAAAGLEASDILLSSGDAPVRDTVSLTEIVQASQGEAIELQIIRGGERQVITITPGERPATAGHTLIFQAEGEELPEAARAWIYRLHEAEGNNEEGAIPSFRFFHPGAVVPSGNFGNFSVTGGFALPEGMSYSFIRDSEGNDWGTLTRGDESWEVTEDTLSDIPENIRPLVARLLLTQQREDQGEVVQPLQILGRFLASNTDAAGDATAEADTPLAVRVFGTFSDDEENTASWRAIGGQHGHPSITVFDAHRVQGGTDNDDEILQRLDMLQRDLDALRQAIELNNSDPGDQSATPYMRWQAFGSGEESPLQFRVRAAVVDGEQEAEPARPRLRVQVREADGEQEAESPRVRLHRAWIQAIEEAREDDNDAEAESPRIQLYRERMQALEDAEGQQEAQPARPRRRSTEQREALEGDSELQEARRELRAAFEVYRARLQALEAEGENGSEEEADSPRLQLYRARIQGLNTDAAPTRPRS